MKTTPTPTPTPTPQRAAPTLKPGSPSLTISISPNPVQLGGQVTVSCTGVPGDQITPYISEVALNDGFSLDSTGHHNDNEKVSAEIGSGMGITQPGTYGVYYYDWTAHVQSNTVSLVVTSGTLADPAFNLPANSTITATPEVEQTPGPEATVTANTGNDTTGNSVSVTPVAEQTNSTTVIPLPSSTAKPSPAFPMDAAAIALAGAALLVIEHSRKE